MPGTRQQVPVLQRERKNRGQAGCWGYLASQRGTVGAGEKPAFPKSQGCCRCPPTLSGRSRVSALGWRGSCRHHAPHLAAQALVPYPHRGRGPHEHPTLPGMMPAAARAPAPAACAGVRRKQGRFERSHRSALREEGAREAAQTDRRPPLRAPCSAPLATTLPIGADDCGQARGDGDVPHAAEGLGTAAG